MEQDQPKNGTKQAGGESGGEPESPRTRATATAASLIQAAEALFGEIPKSGAGLAAPVSAEDLTVALRFVHLMGTQNQARIAELSASLYALLETMIAGGKLALADYEARRQETVQRENERTARQASVQIANVPDKYALTDLPRIDCAARLPLCRARCCQLRPTLSVQDLDERVLQWDYGSPYVIARRQDGYCVHNRDHRCSVYAERPGACRVYDCRKDVRIWQDFDKGVLAGGEGSLRGL